VRYDPLPARVHPRAARERQLDPSIPIALLALEQRLLQPALRQAPSELAVLLADGFVEIGASGTIFDKAQVIRALATESPRSFEFEDFRVVEVTADVMLATYRATSGQRTSLRSSLWRRDGGTWQLVFHQGTLAAR
jgi:hypothetical protein